MLRLIDNFDYTKILRSYAGFSPKEPQQEYKNQIRLVNDAWDRALVLCQNPNIGQSEQSLITSATERHGVADKLATFLDFRSTKQFVKIHELKKNGDTTKKINKIIYKKIDENIFEESIERITHRYDALLKAVDGDIEEFFYKFSDIVIPQILIEQLECETDVVKSQFLHRLNMYFLKDEIKCENIIRSKKKYIIPLFVLSFIQEQLLLKVEIPLDHLIRSSVSVSEPLVEGSLESIYQDFAFSKEISEIPVDFADYFYPNEKNPERLKEHLAPMREGFIVSTGTERSLFNLLFAPKDKCKGVLIFDINPRTKLYNDFNVLLIRLCETPEQYVEISKPIKDEDDFRDRLCKIATKLAESSLPKALKEYYFAELKRMGAIFFSNQRHWRSDKLNSKYQKHKFNNYKKNDFAACRYDQNPEQYKQIREYALSGNIVTICKSILDVSSLDKNDQFSVIDTSNIHDYTYLNFSKVKNEQTIVIYTDVIDKSQSIYSSYLLSKEQLDEEEAKQVKDGLDKYTSCVVPQDSKHMAGYYYHKALVCDMKLRNWDKADELPLGNFATRSSFNALNINGFLDIRPK